MDELARSLLARLLRMGEKHEVGSRARVPALTVTALTEYRQLRELRRKEEVEAAFKAARAEGAVRLAWDRAGEEDGGYVDRVDLVDAVGLARFLGVVPASVVRSEAQALLAPFCEEFPVLRAVEDRWAQLKTVRGYSAHDAHAWRDAAITVQQARALGDSGEVPVRMFSARVFKDSKRIEAITPALDVVLVGSLDAEVRESHAVWLELGLVREEQPVRLAGRLRIVRERVTALLDAPYAAFPAAAIQAVAPDENLTEVVSIENLTTFHQEAKRRCDEPALLLYTGGAPSPAWRAMYGRLLHSLPPQVPIRHWGDVDEGGYRIAAQIAAVAQKNGRQLEPFKMHPRDVPEDSRRPAPGPTIERMKAFAEKAGWSDIASALNPSNGFTVEQEAI
jgi:hypothetical protein